MSDIVTGPARGLLGYGQHAPQIEWPGGAKVAVNIVVNYEEGSEQNHADGDARNETFGEVPHPFPDAIRNLSVESVYEYGSRAGVWRLFRILREFQVPATVFACAVALERNPAVAEQMRIDGHDLLAHGWRWEEHWNLSREAEAERIAWALASFKRTCGERPRGWYCRFGPSVNTRELVVAEGGFSYDSDAYNDDLPYFVNVNCNRHLVVPYSLTYNDVQSTMPGELADLWKRGLDELWHEGAHGSPKMMSIGLHPRLIGQAGRASALREFLEYAQGKEDVWFARRGDIADWWHENYSDLQTLDR
jgi:peptidoglycan/xylan/chitin deacetylase (PgdA/CDA1 family)